MVVGVGGARVGVGTAECGLSPTPADPSSYIPESKYVLIFLVGAILN